MPSDQLIVLVGGSGTGKSTAARALQEQLLPAQWLHISPDTILYCLPPSTLEAANNRNDWSNIDVPSIGRTAMFCLQSILGAGNRVIYECVVMTERGARDLIAGLHVYRPLIVALTCSMEETGRRTLARDDRTLEEAEYGFATTGRSLSTPISTDSGQTSKKLLAGVRSAFLTSAGFSLMLSSSSSYDDIITSYTAISSEGIDAWTSDVGPHLRSALYCSQRWAAAFGTPVLP